MTPTTRILLIILAVIVVGGGAFVLSGKSSIVLPWAKNTNVINTNTTTTNTVVTNTAAPTNVTVTLPTEVKGDTVVAGTLKVGDTVVTISSQQKQTTADGETADKGKTFLYVYVDPIEPANVLAVNTGLRTAVVNDGKTSYPLESLKIASTSVKGDRGFLRFTIPDTAKNLQLQLGTGTALQSVTLK